MSAFLIYESLKAKPLNFPKIYYSVHFVMSRITII